MASALAFCLMSWAMQRKGPLYVSVFSPLLLVVVAIFSWALLEEKLYTGTYVSIHLYLSLCVFKHYINEMMMMNLYDICILGLWDQHLWLLVSMAYCGGKTER